MAPDRRPEAHIRPQWTDKTTAWPAFSAGQAVALVVRHQGLEPRTRWLRASEATCRRLSERASRCHFRTSMATACAARCRPMSVQFGAAEHTWSTACSPSHWSSCTSPNWAERQIGRPERRSGSCWTAGCWASAGEHRTFGTKAVNGHRQLLQPAQQVSRHRYDKTATSYRTMIDLAALLIWRGTGPSPLTTRQS